MSEDRLVDCVSHPSSLVGDPEKLRGALQAIRGLRRSVSYLVAFRQLVDDLVQTADDLGIIIVKNSEQVRELIGRLTTFNALFEADPDSSTLLHGDPQARRIFDPQAHSKLITELRSLLSKT